jgi:hypothetical protein
MTTALLASTANAAALQAAAVPAWVWATLLMTGFVALSVATMVLARVALRQPAVTPSEPPEDEARRALDDIAAAGLVDRAAPAYYAALAGALRRYLARRFALPAGTMPVPEIERRLLARGEDEAWARRAAGLLERAEAAQSADEAPSRERAQADLTEAYEIVSAITPDVERETGGAEG